MRSMYCKYTGKELYSVSEGKLCLSPEKMRELTNEDFNDYPDVVGHVCESCDEENIEENMLEYDGSWWCKDCRLELRRCDYCGTVWDSSVVGRCPECKS